MKNRLKLVLALGAMVALAGVAQADFNVLDKSTWYQNGATGAKVDASGNAYTTEASKDRDNWRIVNLINNQLTASGAGVAPFQVCQ